MSTGSVKEVNMILDDFKIFQKSSKEKLDEIETDSSSISHNLSEANNKLDQIATLKAQAINELDDLERISIQTYEHSESVKGLADKATTLESNLSSYEDSLDDYLTKFRQLYSEIEKLHSGATSSSLASAYRERKDSFKTPKRVWASIFVFSLCLLFVIFAVNPIDMRFEIINTGNIASYLASKIPFVIPVIWLAISSNRRHAETLRLEEDYAHKEALSKSFKGYKKQAEEMDFDLESNSPVNRLFKEVLSAISLHPGRAYGTKAEMPTDSLINELTNKK